MATEGSFIRPLSTEQQIVHSSPRNCKSSSSVFNRTREPVFSSAQSTESLTLRFRPAPPPALTIPPCDLFSNPPPAVRTFGRPLVANCPPILSVGDPPPSSFCRSDSLWPSKIHDRSGCHEVVFSASSMWNGAKSCSAKETVVLEAESDRPTLMARTEVRVSVISRI